MDQYEEQFICIKEVFHPVGISLSALARSGYCSYPQQSLEDGSVEEVVDACFKHEVASYEDS